MPKIVSVQKMIAIEQAQVTLGVSLDQLMRTAGAELARVAEEYSDSALGDKKALALAGSGNNGGDALVAIAILAQAGWHCSVLFVGERNIGDILIEEAKAAGCSIIPNIEEIQTVLKDSPIVIDGILGTGFKLPLREKFATKLGQLKGLIQKYDCQVFAVDCPSGVDCDSGDCAHEAIPADVTVCMAAVKQGLLKAPTSELCGEIFTVDIGITEKNPVWKSVIDEVITADRILQSLPLRRADSHKGSFGKVMVCGGCDEYPGAPVLSAMGAYSVGAGLARLATPAISRSAFAGQIPEAVWAVMPDEDGYLGFKSVSTFERYIPGQNVVVFGPGMGQASSVVGFAAEALLIMDSEMFRGQGTRLVLDADGLRLIAKIENWNNKLPANTVITPHPGEFEAISAGLRLDESDRITKAKAGAKAWNCVVVLKGAYTVIAAPDGRTALIPIATSSLAKAGTGDVLTGMIAGLMAQGQNSFEAAVTGAGLHAMAGQMAADDLKSDRSVMASDLRFYIGDVLSRLREQAGSLKLLGI